MSPGKVEIIDNQLNGGRGKYIYIYIIRPCSIYMKRYKDMNNREIERWKKKNKILSDAIGNNFNANLKRYNELMLKISEELGIPEQGEEAPDTLPGTIDDIDKYELNRLHGKFWCKYDPIQKKTINMDINMSVMDYIPSQLETKFTKVDWIKYWEKRKNEPL